MEAVLLKKEIYTKVDNLTDEQLQLVSDFVGLIEKVQLIKKNKKQTKPTANGKRDMKPIYELQKIFKELGTTSFIDDAISEREERL
jgi:hypothetical protein